MDKKLASFGIRTSILYTLILTLVGTGAYAYTYTKIQESEHESDFEIASVDLASQIQSLLREKQALERSLDDLKTENETLAKRLGRLNNKVDTLEKLKEIDKELLQKYSKVYFLNENYAPKELKKIDQIYSYNKDKEFFLHAEVVPFLERMLKRAERDGMHIRVISAYRSFAEQKSLKGTYTTVYGTTAANKFSADQGYSEHQLGTTVDLTTEALGAGYTSFQKTKEYLWLKDNAYRYGFILSYPQNNKYYVFEPWHWRFVGESLAERLHDDNIEFYDLDQREIDEYLIKLFD